ITECTATGAFADPKSDTTTFPNGSLCDITGTATKPGTGLVNPAPITVGWPYTQKGTTTCSTGPCPLDTGLFFEGAIDLTALGLGNFCAHSFLAETRSSAEVSAVLKDFALGSFNTCVSLTVTKTPSTTSLCAAPGTSAASVSYTYVVHNTSPVPINVTLVDNAGTPGVTADDIDVLASSGSTIVTVPSQPARVPSSISLAANGSAGDSATRTPTLSLRVGSTTNFVTATGSFGGATQTATATATVTVNPNPTCGITGPSAACTGTTGLVYTSTGTNINSHSWSISGNGT